MENPNLYIGEIRQITTKKIFGGYYIPTDILI